MLHIVFIPLLLCYPQALALQSKVPMNYYTVFHHISQLLPHDCIIVSEGANTMDIGRTMLNNYLPRHRQGGLVEAKHSQNHVVHCVTAHSCMQKLTDIIVKGTGITQRSLKKKVFVIGYRKWSPFLINTEIEN